VTTLDLVPRAFDRPQVPHIEADLTVIDPARLAGFDLILCCETLEHLPWDAAAGVLRTFSRSGAGWLITSVPYEGLQFDFRLYVNPFRLRRRLVLKKGRGLRRFRADADPFGHKWECGYRGTGLAAWERQLAGSGWRIRRREFTSPCRSVFHLLENAGTPD
jgi:hypothetical protein